MPSSSPWGSLSTSNPRISAGTPLSTLQQVRCLPPWNVEAFNLAILSMPWQNLYPIHDFGTSRIPRVVGVFTCKRWNLTVYICTFQPWDVGIMCRSQLTVLNMWVLYTGVQSLGSIAILPCVLDQSFFFVPTPRGDQATLSLHFSSSRSIQKSLCAAFMSLQTMARIYRLPCINGYS